jgi:type I restriction enzyme S subunit
VEECRITDPRQEQFVTVRVNGRGAVPRKIGDGKTPIMDRVWRLRSGDLVYSRIDARKGAFALVPEELDGAVVSKDFPTFEIDRSQVNPAYLIAYLGTPSFFAQLQASSFGTTNRQRITESMLLSYTIPLPPLVEQERIVHHLADAEQLRRLRAQADRRTASLIPAFFHEMLGDPVSNPKGWPTVEMRETFDGHPNYGTMIPPQSEGAWLDLRVANIQNGVLTLSDRKYVDLPPEAIVRHEVRDGDLLFARAIGSVEQLGKCVIAYPGREKWAFDSHLMRVRFRAERVHPEMVRGFLTSPGGRYLFLKKTRESAVQFNINTKEFGSIRLPLPPLHVQHQFADRVAEVRALEAQQAASRRRLDDLFQSLLHRAFRGEL